MTNCESCSHKTTVRPTQCRSCEPQKQTTYVPAPAQAFVPNCDCNFSISQVMNHKGVYVFDIDGCSAKLDIREGVKANETVTHMTTNQAGDVVYENEAGTTEKVNIKDLLPYGKLEDLGNVGNESGADSSELPEGCAFLFKQKGEDYWKAWKTSTHTMGSEEKITGIMGFTEGGCPRYLPAPKTGAATLVAKNGKIQWQAAPLPATADINEFNPAWGNINETKAVNNAPDRKNGIFTHDPAVDKCNDIIVG